MRSPNLPRHNQTNEGLCYSKPLSYISLKKFSSGVKIANFIRNIVCDFGRTVAFSGKHRITSAPLSCHFPHIIKLSSKSKVVWANARRIVAAVKDHHPFRYFLIRHLKTKAVGASDKFIYAEHSISTSIVSRRPIPALAGLVNLAPKSFFRVHKEIIPCASVS